MKPDPYDRPVTFRELERIASAAAMAAQADGRNDAFSTLDDLLSAVCDAASGTFASPAAVADGELLGLYREWRALKSDLDGETMSMDSALWKSGEKRMWEIEEVIAGARAGTVCGLAVKIVVADDGDGWGDPRQKLLVENALAILKVMSP